MKMLSPEMQQSVRWVICKLSGVWNISLSSLPLSLSQVEGEKNLQIVYFERYFAVRCILFSRFLLLISFYCVSCIFDDSSTFQHKKESKEREKKTNTDAPYLLQLIYSPILSAIIHSACVLCVC